MCPHTHWQVQLPPSADAVMGGIQELVNHRVHGFEITERAGKSTRLRHGILVAALGRLLSQQLHPTGAQSRLHPRQGGERDVDGARLDLLDAPGIKSDLLGKLLLREMPAHALAAHTGAESLQQGSGVACKTGTRLCRQLTPATSIEVYAVLLTAGEGWFGTR